MIIIYLIVFATTIINININIFSLFKKYKRDDEAS